jgi:Holliday junction resolvasome RuvABC DNA-binding subunit
MLVFNTPVAVNETNLKSLVGMGFCEQDAREALERADNVQNALDILLMR